MKKLLLLFILLLSLVACSSEDSADPNSNVIELEVADGNVISSKRVANEISSVGEVDRYHVNLVKTNRMVQIKCTQKYDSQEDISGDQQDLALLVQVYEVDANGNLVMVAGDHALEGSTLPADMKINIFVDRAKELYIHVRDLMDDDSSSRPYYISANYEAAPDGNDSAASSETATLEIDGDSHVDAIGNIGDVDFFNIIISEAGIYDTTVTFDRFAGVDIDLAMDLTNADGVVLDSRTLSNSGTVHMVHYLPAGEYTVSLEDEGRDDFAQSAQYTINISEVGSAGVEVNENDTPSFASDTTNPVSVDGSIDYFTDQDWYIVNQADGVNLSVLDLGFNSTSNMSFQLSVYEIADPAAFEYGTDNPVYVHNYRRIHDGEHHAIIKLDRSLDYFVMVKATDGDGVAAGVSYTLNMVLSNIIDNDDETGLGTNDSNAFDLNTQNDPHDGKIAFRGDVDWYSITVPSDANQVLSIDVTLPDNPNVEYAFDIKDNTGDLIKTVKNGRSDRKAVDLRTGILVAPDATYKIKVYDLQNDDSDGEGYQIKWSVAVMPGTTPDCSKTGGEPLTTTYNNEDAEANFPIETDITIDYPSESGQAITGTFKVNTTALNMATAPDEGSSPVQVTFPWISGYIDYQGDEDWYGLDLRNYLPSDLTTPDQWYYTIDVELFSPAHASDHPVEYAWEFFPDYSGQRSLARRLASNSDSNLGADELSLTFNSVNSLDSGTCLWVGSGDPNPTDKWAGLVYFRISDFYYMNLSDDDVNPDPDNDWGFDAPYYFRVILKYYPGSNHPPQN